MNAAQTKRIAVLTADIAEVQGVWSDSDEQERAFFTVHLAECHAEIAAIRTADEQARAARNWKRSAAKASKDIKALSCSSSLNCDSRYAEVARIRRNIERSEDRAFARGLSVQAPASELRKQLVQAREAAGRWYSARLTHEIGRRFPVRELSVAEQQYRDELRLARVLRAG